jgi:DNA-binding HxlR family transcriptional regulator
MPYRRKRPPLDPCPVEIVLTMVSGKWKVRVLYLLSREDLTFGEIRTSIGSVSQQVLSALLKELEQDEVVERNRMQLAGLSRYKLTHKGRRLVSLLEPIAEWGNELLSRQGLEWQPPAPVQSRKGADNLASPS